MALLILGIPKKSEQKVRLVSISFHVHSELFYNIYIYIIYVYTLPETNIAPENRPLEKEIPTGNHLFFCAMLVLGSVHTSAIVFMPDICVIYRHQKYLRVVQLFLSTSAEVNSVTGRPCHFDAPALAFLKPARPKVVHRSFQEI